MIGGGVLLLALVYLVVVSPIMALEDSWSQELARKRQLLVKYQSLIKSKAKVVQGNKEMKAALARAEGQFLSGDNPAVASADLQEILKMLDPGPRGPDDQHQGPDAPGGRPVPGGAGPGAIVVYYGAIAHHPLSTGASQEAPVCPGTGGQRPPLDGGDPEDRRRLAG